MGIIQAYSPEQAQEQTRKREKKIISIATENAIADDYSLSQQLLDDAASDDHLRHLLNMCARNHLIGLHPDCFELGVVMTRFAAKFYRDNAEDTL